jgi:hypothetical protein
MNRRDDQVRKLARERSRASSAGVERVKKSKSIALELARVILPRFERRR